MISGGGDRSRSGRFSGRGITWSTVAKVAGECNMPRLPVLVKHVCGFDGGLGSLLPLPPVCLL